MATQQDFVDFVLDQFDADCGVTARKMFGEYGLFSGGKMFALVCDNQLFFKQTEGGRAWMGTIVEGEPYPGAKPALLVEDRLEDGEWMSEMTRITVRELPEPKSKSKGTSKAKKRKQG